MKINKKKGKKIVSEVGAGIAAATAVALAGVFLVYGSKDAAKNRKKIKGWMLKAKGDVLDQLEKMKEVSEETYQTTVDKVTAKYKTLKNVDPAELQAMVKDMKSHWKNIVKEISPKKSVKKSGK
jgi:hypothetical protein